MFIVSKIADPVGGLLYKYRFMPSLFRSPAYTAQY